MINLTSTEVRALIELLETHHTNMYQLTLDLCEAWVEFADSFDDHQKDSITKAIVTVSTDISKLLKDDAGPTISMMNGYVDILEGRSS